MDHDLVTIAIPFFNSESYLSYAIQSVLIQTYLDWELLLIDDGSTDDSQKIAKEYSERDKRIRVLCDGNNKGLAARLNETIAEAKGKYYIRMDADDIMFPDRIQKQVAYLNNNTEIDVVGTSAIIIGKSNNILYSMKDSLKEPQTRRDVINGNLFIHPSVAGKTVWFRNNPYDETKRRSQDFFLWLNSVEHSKFAVVDEPLLFYRVLNNDIWGKFKRDNRTMYSYFKSQLSCNYFMEPLMQCLRQQIRLPLFYCYFHLNGSEGIIKRRYRMLDNEEKNHYTAILKEVTDGLNTI